MPHLLHRTALPRALDGVTRIDRHLRFGQIRRMFSDDILASLAWAFVRDIGRSEGGA
jgi:hypothetical protein